MLSLTFLMRGFCKRVEPNAAGPQRAESTSRIFKRLTSDPEYAKRFRESVKRQREAAKEEIRMDEESERITQADLSIVINAKPIDDLSCEM